MNTKTSRRVSRRDFVKAAGAGSAALWASSQSARAEEEDTRAMPQAVLGKTGERVSRLGLGTAPAGHRSKEEASKFFAQAIERGVTYMDTAPDFTGYGLAQKALGEVLRDKGVRRRVFLVTKTFEPDGEKALKLLKENLRELQTDRADLVYAHSIGDDKMDLDTVLGKGGVLQALDKARRDGLCRFVGVSGHNRPDKFLKVLEEFDVQVMMNAVNPVVRHIYNFEERVWPAAREKNVGLVAMKVLGGMYRTAEAPQGQPREKGGRIRDFTEAAYRYARGLPGLSTVVLGCYDMRELDEAISWTKNHQPLSPEEQQELLARGRKLADDWGQVYGPVS